MSKIILLTGATDGIGLATAKKLMLDGHKLLIHGRNADKLKRTEAALNALGKLPTTPYLADLSNLAEVDAFAKELLNTHPHIDVVINNAGIYKTPTPITPDKLDIRFVVNTLAPYLLTQRLLPNLNKTSRVVNLSSAAQATVDLNALAGRAHINDDFNAYAQSKLAITMWTYYLAKHLKNKTDLVFIAINPGSLLASKMVKEGFGVAGNDINIGANCLLKASLDEEFARASGLYFDNDNGEFTVPHPDGRNIKLCEALIQAMSDIFERLGIQGV